MLGTLVHKGSANGPRGEQGRDAFEGIKKILQAHKPKKKGGMALKEKYNLDVKN